RRLRCSCRSPDLERAHVWCFTEPRFADAHAGGVVEQDAVFLGRPDGMGAQETRTIDLEEEATSFAGTTNDALVNRRLIRIQMIAAAERLEDVRLQFLQS